MVDQPIPQTPPARPLTSATRPIAPTLVAPVVGTTTNDDVDREQADNGAPMANATPPSVDNIVKQLISFLMQLFGMGPQDDTPEPDFEDAPAGADREALRRSYDDSDRQRADRGDNPDFAASARSYFTPVNIATLSPRLAALRTRFGDHLQPILPVADSGVRIVSGYGHRERSADMRAVSATSEHPGLDIAPTIAGTTGIQVVPPMPGIVIAAGWRGGYGNCVETVDIYGMHHRFGHLAHIDVHVGDTVVPPGSAQNANEHTTIGAMGMTGHATGVHLHYEQRNGENQTLDPVILARRWHAGDAISPGQAQTFALAQQHNHGSVQLASADHLVGTSLAAPRTPPHTVPAPTPHRFV